MKIINLLKLKMLSVNYSLNCVTFDPKGKILQVPLSPPSRQLLSID